MEVVETIDKTVPEEDSITGITGARLWNVMWRFFVQAANVIAADHPALAEKLRRASPHWMRHTRSRAGRS